MAFGMTLVDRISFGNLKLRIYTVTDVQSGGSTFNTGMSTAKMVKAVNNTDSADTFKESVGAESDPTTRKQVTFTSVTSNDDGHAWIWGR